MHVHMLLLKDGEPVFSDDNGYSHLSQEAHWFMGGLLKHHPFPLRHHESQHQLLQASGAGL